MKNQIKDFDCFKIVIADNDSFIYLYTEYIIGISLK